MTLEEYKIFKDNFFEEQKLELEKNKKLFKNNISDRGKYNAVYLTHKNIESSNIDGLNIYDIEDELKDFKEYCNTINYGPLSRTELIVESYCQYSDEPETESVKIIMFYSIPSSNSVFEMAAKEKFKKELGNKIRPNDISKYISPIVDCKAIKMFEAGELTYIGLQKMAFGSCDL